MDYYTEDNLLDLVRRLASQVASLKEENRRFQEEIDALREENAALKAENAALAAEIERMRAERTPPPFVKPSRPKRTDEKKPRKKRTENFARKREEPTRTVDHRLSRCPDCGGPLSEGYEKRRRQVIELPEAPVEITDHVIYGHYCCYCQKERVAKPSAEELGAVGEGRFGVRLTSLATLLRIEGRLPLRTIRTLLSVQYQLNISVGELADLLHSTARAGAREAEAILAKVRSAPTICGDETGWRESGRNGYLWSFCTLESAADPFRYFHYDESRGGEVVEKILGDDFGGVVSSDFYSAYNAHLGRHQRCWVHYLRDLKKLKEAHADDPSVVEWVDAAKAIYQAAKEWRPKHPGSRFEEKERIEAREDFEKRLMAWAKPFLGQPDDPRRILAQRAERFKPELFVFVEDPRVPSDNNAAERSLRPSVIARKISGGTRSEKGSETRTTLMTLFGTWKLRGEDLLEACRRMLLSYAALSANASA